MNARKLLALVPGLAALPSALAHCPLCTIGAGIAVSGALWLGVKSIVAGVLFGAFAASMGWWAANAIKKRFKKEWIPFQHAVIVLASFFLTVLPLVPLVPGVIPFYVSLGGGYGTLLNRTYVLNSFFLGSLLGLAVLSVTPWLSERITFLRHGKRVPFQGIALTLGLLLLTGTLLQVL